MKQILVYGDSLSWGIIPGTRNRLPFASRWPGLLETGLNEFAPGSVRVIEDCLNGRRTVHEDPFKAGRNGLTGLAQRIEVNSPLALVILALGTNDFQWNHPFTRAWSAAQGVGTLVQEIRRAPVEPGMPVPPVMILCPPPPVDPAGGMESKFPDTRQRCQGLAVAYQELAAVMGCAYFDATAVIQPSEIDGVHLDETGHALLGKALVPAVQALI